MVSIKDYYNVYKELSAESKYNYISLITVYEELFGNSRIYKISRPNKTYFEDLSIKDLVRKFEHITPKTNFNTIIRLCGEMNKRVAKMLKIYPSKIKLVEIKGNNSNFYAFMQTFPVKNIIEVNINYLKNADGLSILFDILHETYHTYQFQNNQKLANHSKYFDKNCVISYLQSSFKDALNYIKEDDLCKKHKVNNINDVPTSELLNYNSISNLSYDSTLIENEANLFAFNLLNKFKKSNYISGKYDFLTCFEKFETSKQLNETYNPNIIKKELHNAKSNYEKIKKLFVRNYNSFNDQKKEDLKFLFSNIKTKDFNSYYDNLRNRLRQIKSEYLYESQAFWLLNENNEFVQINDSEDKKFAGNNFEDLLI